MACLSEHHKTLTDGVGKCSVPMWSGYGMPDGFCDRSAYGKQSHEHRRRTRKYVPALACDWHGGPSAPTGHTMSDPDQCCPSCSSRNIEEHTPERGTHTCRDCGEWIEDEAHE